MASKTALLIVAEGSEDLEVAIPSDYLRHCGLKVTIASISEEGGPVTLSNGLRILPDVTLESVSKQEYDVIILPGGIKGGPRLAASALVLEMLRSQHARGGLIASICAGATVIAASGVQPGATLSTFPLPEIYDKVTERGYKFANERVAVDGQLITSQAPGTAFEFASKIVETLVGSEVNKKFIDFYLIKM